MTRQPTGYDLRIKRDGDKHRVFDVIRRKWVALTPEEWVRQQVIRYLLEELQFPKALVSVEKQLLVHGLARRTDIVLYNHSGMPVLIIECKAPEVALSQLVADQAARYNLSLQVPYLWVTNGERNAICQISHTDGTWAWLSALPAVEVLLGVG